MSLRGVAHLQCNERGAVRNCGSSVVYLLGTPTAERNAVKNCFQILDTFLQRAQGRTRRCQLQDRYLSRDC